MWRRWSPATGSQFALLPPDNATGNFTKVVQRLSVRVELDDDAGLGERLRPGMSVETVIHTDDPGGRGRAMSVDAAAWRPPPPRRRARAALHAVRWSGSRRCCSGR